MALCANAFRLPKSPKPSQPQNFLKEQPWLNSYKKCHTQPHCNLLNSPEPQFAQIPPNLREIMGERNSQSARFEVLAPQNPCVGLGRGLLQWIPSHQDILKSLQVRYCIDLTPGDGAAALAGYKMGIIYLGLTFTTVHT